MREANGIIGRAKTLGYDKVLDLVRKYRDPHTELLPEERALSDEAVAASVTRRRRIFTGSPDEVKAHRARAVAAYAAANERLRSLAPRMVVGPPSDLYASLWKAEQERLRAQAVSRRTHNSDLSRPLN